MRILNAFDPEENKVLRTPCEAVRDLEKAKNIVAQMVEALKQNLDGIALAANQIGINRRVVVIRDTKGRFRELINPVITEKNERTIEYIERCLSIPNIGVKTHRPDQVTVEYSELNPDIPNERRTAVFHEKYAVVIQHEIDHLDGKLATDVGTPMLKVANKRKPTKKKRKKRR